MVAQVASVAFASTGGGNVTVARPTGTTDGDLLIAVAGSDWGTFAASNVPASFLDGGGGLTLATSDYDGGSNNMHLALGARFASSEPSNYTFPGASDSDPCAGVFRITGFDTTQTLANLIKQIAPAVIASGSGAVAAPSIVPFSTDDLLICFAVLDGAAGGGTLTYTAPSGMTERIDIQPTTFTALSAASLESPANPSGTKTFVTTPTSHDKGAAATISIKSPAAGGPTLTVANIGQAQHPTTPTLTQVHVLAVVNVAQAQHPTTPTLTQVHVLAVVNVAQAQHPASLALVQNSSLAVANVGQSQSIAVPTLTQVHQLTAANVGQAQHPTAPALTQAHQLAVSGVGQAQGPAVPTLAQTHVLSVAGVVQAQAPGTVALTQVHVLAVSGAGQAQHPASLTLSGPGTLAVAGVGQAQHPSTPALTQVHQLAVAGVGQAQHPANVSLVAPGNLVITGVKQAQSAGPVTLTQAHQLVAAAVVQGQFVATVTVAQDHQLIVEGVTQGQEPGAALIFVIPPGGSGELDNWLTLGDLMDARATHELIMIDQISVRHPGMIDGVFDPDLGYAPAAPREPYYTGKATVQARQISAGQLSPAGLGTLTQLGYAVHGPVGTAIDGAAPGDVITVTDSADPRYVGLKLTVKNVESSSFVTARRLVCTVYEPSTP